MLECLTFSVKYVGQWSFKVKNDALFIQMMQITACAYFVGLPLNAQDGGFPMNDPEVMERIARALELIAYYLGVQVGQE